MKMDESELSQLFGSLEPKIDKSNKLDTSPSANKSEN